MLGQLQFISVQNTDRSPWEEQTPQTEIAYSISRKVTNLSKSSQHIRESKCWFILSQCLFEETFHWASPCLLLCREWMLGPIKCGPYFLTLLCGSFTSWKNHLVSALMLHLWYLREEWLRGMQPLVSFSPDVCSRWLSWESRPRFPI